ncbi:DUF2147 domain-containing protein [Parendozoicomonas haliclonae]|uniref:DUF2147 domain-containing protein n=1 Tax=Parendozoicomonas haliclonae TaxID=1960125 RepID=A0A1X7AKH5_9GAMM|nr:DUF2147 domain-containing protein [Parendozoicomonas haliclonae]SMA47202.1 hypothetical protein EHSB41UT_02339 [Parendozoicomonas haliclonae]
MRLITRGVLPVLLALTALVSQAWASAAPEYASPAGLWITYDENTHEPISYVRITEDNGIYNGKVEKILVGTDADKLCVACTGSNKNQPIEGMEIIWNMQPDGDNYDNGKILDPDNGKTYSANMKLMENGRKLKVRGYIGIPLVGRSQVWVRKEATAQDNIQ